MTTFIFTIVWDSKNRNKACLGHFEDFPYVQELKDLAQMHFRPDTESWPILYVKMGKRQEDRLYSIKEDRDLLALHKAGILAQTKNTISVKFRKPKKSFIHRLRQ